MLTFPVENIISVTESKSIRYVPERTVDQKKGDL